MKKFQTLVIGLGAMGSAALYQLSKKGFNVLGIDQFAPPHKLGSTHGDTRITRQAIGEGEEYVPLSLRSYEIWRELEKETGEDLLTITGGLIIGDGTANSLHGSGNFLRVTIDAAEKFDIEHEVLSADAIKRRFPQFRVEPGYIGYYETQAGFLRPEKCVEVQLSQAARHGAEINLNEKVEKIVPLADGSVKVQTDKAEYWAERAIVTSGPWITEFFPEYSSIFRIYRQVLYWFDVQDSIEEFLPENCPVYIVAGVDGKGIYGFPAIDGPNGGIKVSFEEYKTETTPATADLQITNAEIERAYEKYISTYLLGLSRECIKAVSCLYTVTPDSGFVIDFHPEHPQIIIGSPCSGHGFKHSAAIGEALADLAIDSKSRFDLDPFRLRRFR